MSYSCKKDQNASKFIKKLHDKQIFRQIKQTYSSLYQNSNLKQNKMSTFCNMKPRKNTKIRATTRKVNDSNKTENKTLQLNFKDVPLIIKQRLVQMERICQSMPDNKNMALQYDIKNIKKRWQKQIIQNRISQKSYEKIKKFAKEKKQIYRNNAIFGNLNKKSMLKYQQYQKIIKQKSDDLLSFFYGFPYQNKKMLNSEFSEKISLTMYQRKIHKSQSLDKIYTNLIKNKKLHGVNEKQLGQNFISVAYINEIHKQERKSQKNLVILKTIANCTS